MLYHVYEGHTKSNEHVCMMLKQMCMYKNKSCPHFMKSTFWSLHFCQSCSACIHHGGRCPWPCLPSFMDFCIFRIVLATHWILQVTELLVFWCGQVWAAGRIGGLFVSLLFHCPQCQVGTVSHALLGWGIIWLFCTIFWHIVLPLYHHHTPWWVCGEF